MSRTTLCILTAAVLSLLAAGSMFFRFHVLGDEIHAPTGPGIWKITFMIEGQLQGQARIFSLSPLDTPQQRLLRESCRSEQLVEHNPDARKQDHHGERRYQSWSKRAGVADGPFRARCEFYCATEGQAHSDRGAARDFHGPPHSGEYLEAISSVAAENERLSATARQLVEGMTGHGEQTEALYDFVSRKIRNEPTVGNGPGATAFECLESSSGDARAQSRLLTALLRSRGIPARMVTGLHLVQADAEHAQLDSQLAHYWVEAWLHDHWLPMCPFNHHFGQVPSSYLVFGYGDFPMVRGRQAADLEYAFLVQKTSQEEALGLPQPSRLKKVLRSLRLNMLPSAEQKLVEFLLLLPVAALIICIFRNLIGLHSFGTFAPALVGLAFRDLHTMPGMLVFVSILLVGWLMRRVMDRYHLLQVPRIAFMLSTVVVLLIIVVVAANFRSLEATKYISLFPMVILTSMIERFWTLETEDGTSASFRTLLITIFISATIALTLSLPFVVDHMLSYPETIGLIMAAQLLIGRYTGYRLTELFRFRDFLGSEPPLRLRAFDGK